MGNFRWSFVAVVTVAALWSGAALAKSAFASADEATGMVEEGVAFIKAGGKDTGWAEISSKTGQFRDRDLDPVVYGLSGIVHAHGADEKMIGHNLIDSKDGDGKRFVQERLEMGKAKPAVWRDNTFTNPVSRKVEPKSMYCEHLEDTVVCGGVHTN